MKEMCSFDPGIRKMKELLAIKLPELFASFSKCCFVAHVSCSPIWEEMFLRIMSHLASLFTKSLLYLWINILYQNIVYILEAFHGKC